MEKNIAIQLSKHPDVWHGEGRHPGTCPVDKGVPSKLKGSRSWAPLTGASCWPWSQSPGPRAATFSLRGVRPGLKTRDLKPLVVEVSLGNKAKMGAKKVGTEAFHN